MGGSTMPGGTVSMPATGRPGPRAGGDFAGLVGGGAAHRDDACFVHDILASMPGPCALVALARREQAPAAPGKNPTAGTRPMALWRYAK